MRKHKKNPSLNVKRKNANKTIKVIVQIVLLTAVLFVLVGKIFVVRHYAEPVRAEWNQQRGFTAVSYFGVARKADAKSVSRQQLEAQLKALHDDGYVTISQQDIIDYYFKGKALPDKALFLSFEDGRNDSALFAQPILEKYNYKATFLTYADKMGDSQGKFVQPKQMQKMLKSGFWEMGSNGYRLSYINVFDNQGISLGVKDEKTLPDKTKIGYYNHYLMDFIRDENMIPIENRADMQKRIAEDYTRMQNVYTDTLGYVPGVYMIMHANSLGSNMNKLVSEANSTNIEQLFSMHFNREGSSYNTRRSGIYNLTRVQPGASWSTNHLLMKLREDSKQDTTFVVGDVSQAGNWTVSQGAAEFNEDRIVLTSRPGKTGRMHLNTNVEASNLSFSAKLLGSVVGSQSVSLGSTDQLKISLADNQLLVEQKTDGKPFEQLFAAVLPPVEWHDRDIQLNKASVYTQSEVMQAKALDETDYPSNLPGNRNLTFTIQGDKLQLSIDGNVQINDLRISPKISDGTLALESVYSSKNKKDNIYDAVFQDVNIRSAANDGAEEQVWFTNKASGLQSVGRTLSRSIDHSINWAIDTF
ncbi:polysaccharide deacetylase family protein [Saccharibacillus kuerlensis]|uniref:NodB homology domain-containing protein n=1 Tax=Saccharibacillus kuerlensis TaxID=459527 RepID=A0ABQ2L6D3_9BACL|nr:polysaccharide deacetylase family protein [Saccharibacillus kuerlensis]GGO04908.1 hypothetical protein GCM10010969_30660 [Saccharibacillus kuerlensis]